MQFLEFVLEAMKIVLPLALWWHLTKGMTPEQLIAFQTRYDNGLATILLGLFLIGFAIFIVVTSFRKVPPSSAPPKKEPAR